MVASIESHGSDENPTKGEADLAVSQSSSAVDIRLLRVWVVLWVLQELVLGFIERIRSLFVYLGNVWQEYIYTYTPLMTGLNSLGNLVIN